MTSTLPPDPYKLLGVTKDAKLPEIRSCHRKLVLKCHPDKVQDAALKAIKQGEFQKVQQAYELLSDESRRLQYDEQVKLFELRKEMGRGNPTPRSNPFEYEVKTAEPRASSYGRSKVYSYPTSVPRSNEEVYNERRVPRKSASNESASERKRATKEEEMRLREAAARKAEEERQRQKERERESKKVHREKKKSSDKDRRRVTDEKVRARAPYVEDDSSDEEPRRAAASRAEAARASERKTKHRMEEEIRSREEAVRAAEAAAARHAQQQQRPKEAPMNEKWSEYREFAGAYMQAARLRRVEADTDKPVHPQMRRAETFSPASSPSYGRYTAAPPQYSDDDMPKRSSVRPKESSRRSSESPALRTEKSSRRRSPPAPSDPYIVELPSPAPTPRGKPSLTSYSSAPPLSVREVPNRSKTQDYQRKEASIPPLPRAATFQSGDRVRVSGASSKLRTEYTSDSEPDSPVYNAPRPQSPPPTSRRGQPTRYIVENGYAFERFPRTHRTDMREDYPPVTGETPRVTPSRPSITRSPPSSERPRTSRSQSSYYEAESSPSVLPVRPKLNQEGSGWRGSSRVPAGGAYFDNVQYGPKYQPEHVIYSAHAAGIHEYGHRSSEGRDRDYSGYRRGPVYA